MRFGLGHLRHSPREFWSMTLIEYDAALAGYLESKGVKAGPAGMTRKRIDELKRLYPDT